MRNRTNAYSNTERQFSVLRIAIWQDLIQRTQVTKHRITDSSDSHSALCFQSPLNRISNCSEKCMKNTSETLESSRISLT